MWLYTVLRFALFLALWGVLYLAGLSGLFAALLAVVLSVPLSFVLLAKPRAAFARSIEQRAAYRQDRKAAFDAELDGADEPRRRPED
jgi:O-antigen ligase